MKYTTVSIPKPLEDKVRRFIKKTGFNSTSSFVAFVIRELLMARGGKPVIAEQEEIEKRLRRLGYFKNKRRLP